MTFVGSKNFIVDYYFNDEGFYMLLFEDFVGDFYITDESYIRFTDCRYMHLLFCACIYSFFDVVFCNYDPVEILFFDVLCITPSLEFNICWVV